MTESHGRKLLRQSIILKLLTLSPNHYTANHENAIFGTLSYQEEQLANVFCAPLCYSKLYVWPKEVRVIFLRRENMKWPTLLVKKELVVFIIISFTSRNIEGISRSQILKSVTFKL